MLTPKRRIHGLVSWLALGAAAMASTIASPAAAQTLPSLDARTWRPSTDPNASLVVEPAVTPGPGVVSFGGYAHYSLRPVTLRRAGTDDVAFRPVEHVFGFDMTSSIGIGQRLALGVAVPLIVYQDGSGGLPSTVSEVDHAPMAALGDIGLTVKGSIVRNEGGGFGLGALGYVSLPTGDRASFAGEGSTTVSARLLAEYTLLVAVAQASVGYKLRTDHHSWPSEQVGGYRFGDELPWSVGFAIRPGIFGIDPDNRQRLELAAHGWLPMGPVMPFGAGDPGSAALSPALLAVSDRIELGRYRDTFLLAGAEFGMTDAVGVPAMRIVAALGWAPHEHDMDHDGVKDDVDACPEIPEDRDGFEDSDGCPEIDNDDDGVIDKEDRCPNVKGVPSDSPSKNGCPAGDGDGDGIDDTVDACPTVKGPTSDDPKLNGCPTGDSDSDGIIDAVDKCPTQAEDKDGFQDDDGCPDPDNDGDGISDHEDACPNAAGARSADPVRNGCPNLDRDGDTYDNLTDKCPEAAEVFNGVTDDDGCPDEGGKLLVTIDDKRNVRLAAPIVLRGEGDAVEVDPASTNTLRALALELNKHPEWTLAVGARPAAGDPTKAQLDALARSFAVVRGLSTYAQRDGVAETVGFEAVRQRPQAETGMAFLILQTSTPPRDNAPLPKAEPKKAEEPKKAP